GLGAVGVAPEKLAVERGGLLVMPKLALALGGVGQLFGAWNLARAARLVVAFAGGRGGEQLVEIVDRVGLELDRVEVVVEREGVPPGGEQQPRGAVERVAVEGHGVRVGRRDVKRRFSGLSGLTSQELREADELL